jgi:trans-aconitate methyltransferase
LCRGLSALEVGAGTGIATVPLVDRGLKITALEPAPAMAELARAKLGSRARVEVSRFEDWTASDTVHLIAAFNAWHWIEPNAGIAKVTELLAPGGALAIVWTEVVAWGSPLFEGRLADAFGAPWPKNVEQFIHTLDPIIDNGRFADLQIRRHRVERELDADSFVAVTRTYGGTHTAERDGILRDLINEEMGGSVTKVEDAVLYLTRL